MLVYRIGKTEYARDLEGTGAKLYGGRWNHIGTPCIYTSESRALAVLEFLVNVNIDFMPKSLSIATLEIDEKRINTVPVKDLPENWQHIPAPSPTKDLGSRLLDKNVAIIKVPSVVIEDEYNYIINPLAGSRFLKLVEVKDFVYDVRIRKN